MGTRADRVRRWLARLLTRLARWVDPTPVRVITDLELHYVSFDAAPSLDPSCGVTANRIVRNDEQQGS